ncbi:MAG: YncE family protein [Tepidisphaeraceae bacterium]
MNILSHLSVAALLGLSTYAVAGDVAAFRVEKTFSIGGPGRWDYVTVDAQTHRLYLTRSTHTDVIDDLSGHVIGDIPGGEGLHGVALVPQVNRGYISDGRASELIVFDLKTNAVLGKIPAADDVDGIIYDAGSDRVLASCGDAEQLIVLDPHADLATAKVKKIDLGGKPESLAADGKGRAYVCLHDKASSDGVEVASGKVLDRWSTGTGIAPTGLAIDAKNGRLFVGCRNQKLVVLSTADGKVLAELPIGAGNDACDFDPGTGEAFASCGDGTVSVAKETSPGAFGVVQTLTTRPGGRTAGLDRSTHTLFVPFAELEPAPAGQKKRPAMKPGSFQVLVISRPTSS